MDRKKKKRERKLVVTILGFCINFWFNFRCSIISFLSFFFFFLDFTSFGEAYIYGVVECVSLGLFQIDDDGKKKKKNLDTKMSWAVCKYLVVARNQQEK